MKTPKGEQKTSKGVKEKAPSLQENRITESTECSKMGNRLQVSKNHEQKTSAMASKNQRSESIVHKHCDLVKHSSNLPGYLQSWGKSGNIQEKTFDFGVLDWNLLEKWKSNTKPSISSNNLPHDQSKSHNLQALLHLTVKNDIPFFKLMSNTSNNILVATVKKFPSGKDDSTLTYTFYSVHEFKRKIVGHMTISSSYHAEFSGLERDLFVVRESVLYGPDLGQSDSELAAIIVKNTSKENYGGLGRSKSTVVVLPGDAHSLPKSGQPSSLTNRWKSGGACDCGGWDIGCELQVLGNNQSELNQSSNQSTSDHIDLCYQGSCNKKRGFRLGSVENGVFSLEYDESIMSLLQAFSICVAVISSQNLSHIFQVNHFQDVSDFIITKHRKVKSQTSVHNKMPPASTIGWV